MMFQTAADYTTEQTDLIRAVTLTAATILGDYMDDLVVVGGLVPSLLIQGLEIAFNERIRVRLDGTTLFGETASREIPVCNPGAFIILKALAFRNRGKFKDAYDLYYMTRNFGSGTEDVASYLIPLIGTAPGRRAVGILREDFLDERALGPMRVALFATGVEDSEIQADVVGFVSELLRMSGV